MGRTGLRVNSKANGVRNSSRSAVVSEAEVATNGSPERNGKTDHMFEERVLNGKVTGERKGKNNDQGEKISEHVGAERILEAEVQNLSNMNLVPSVKSASAVPVNEMVNGNSLCFDDSNGATKNDASVEVSHKSVDSHSPDPEKKMEIIAGKQRYPITKSLYDEEDNWSLASSTATSARTKVTVPVAPRFTCVDRLERRKEFYTKLEEKHKALEIEKHEYQARIKEEEHTAIKLLRQNMSYKANPVPSFYREGPPAKVELKKLPVTRAKSPNFTRRKSCGDAVAKSLFADKTPRERAARHSLGTIREAAKLIPMSSRSKSQNVSANSNGSNKVRSQPRPLKVPHSEEQPIQILLES